MTWTAMLSRYKKSLLPRNFLRSIGRYSTVVFTVAALVLSGPLEALIARADTPDAPAPLSAAKLVVSERPLAVYLLYAEGDGWATDSEGFSYREDTTQPPPVRINDIPYVPYRAYAFSDAVAVELPSADGVQVLALDTDSLDTTVFAGSDISSLSRLASQELQFEALSPAASDSEEIWSPLVITSSSIDTETLIDRVTVTRRITLQSGDAELTGSVTATFGFDGTSVINKWTYLIDAVDNAPDIRLRAVTDIDGEVSAEQLGSTYMYRVTLSGTAPILELATPTPSPTASTSPEPTLTPTDTSIPSDSPTPAPTDTVTPTPTETDTPTPTPTPTELPTPSPTEMPTETPAPEPTESPVSMLQRVRSLLVPDAFAEEPPVEESLPEVVTPEPVEVPPVLLEINGSPSEPFNPDTVEVTDPVIPETVASSSETPTPDPMPIVEPEPTPILRQAWEWLQGLFGDGTLAQQTLVLDVSDHNGPVSVTLEGNRMIALFSTADVTPDDAVFYVDPSFGAQSADTGVTITSGDGTGTADFRIHFNPSLGGAIDELFTGADFTTNKVATPASASGSLTLTTIGPHPQTGQPATLTVIEASPVRVVVESELAVSPTQALLERYVVYPSGRVIHTTQVTTDTPETVLASFNAATAQFPASYTDTEDSGALYLSDTGPDLLMYWHDPAVLASASVTSQPVDDSSTTAYAIPVPEGQTTWYQLIELTQPDLDPLVPDTHRRYPTDYRSPDAPVMTRGSFLGFSSAHAAYQFEAVNNVVVFKLNGNIIPRINPTFELSAWTDPDLTAFKAQLNGSNLVEGIDYVIGFLNGDAYSGTLLFQYLHTVDANDRFGVEGGPALFDLDPSDGAAIRRVQSGTEAIDAATTTYTVTLPTAVVTSRSFVLSGDRWGGSLATLSDPEKSRWAGWLASPTSLVLQRTNPDAGLAASQSWQVVEFVDNSGALVQRGSVSWASGTTSQDITLPTPVDTNKAFVLITRRSPDTTQTIDEQWTVRASLSATTLNLSRNESGLAIDITWQVVQLDGITVQRGLTTLSTTGTNVTLNSINPDKSFVVASARAAAATNGVDAQYQYNSQLTSSTNLRLSRSSANNSVDIAWFVVTFSGTSGTHVQRGTVGPTIWTAPVATAYQATDVAIPTAVVATRSMVLTTVAWGAGSGGAEGTADLDATTFGVRQLNAAGTSFRMARYHGGAFRTASTSWEVVQWTKPSIQQNRYRWRNDDGTEVTATAIAAENASASLPVGSIARLRFGLYNSDTGGSTNQYRLEFARKAAGGTCSTGLSAGWSWSQVPVSATTASDAFEIEDSLNLTDASATTNAAGVLTDDDTVFIAGEVKDTGNQTTSIGMASTSFTEIEYSLTPTGSALVGGKYCFRVTDAGETNASKSFIFYPRYAEAQVSAGTYAFTQNTVRWYTNLDDLTPLDPWTSGGPVVKASTSFTTAGTTSWTVPAGVTAVTVWVWGAGGGGGEGAGGGSAGGSGGAGGFTKGTFAVTPGENLIAFVGTGGVANTGTQGAGNGGGFSSIRRGTLDLVQAGGGGGGGAADSGAGEVGGNGGAGGGTDGIAGQNGGPGNNDSGGGGGGTQTAGGAGGSLVGGTAGTAGIADAGGNGGQAGTGGAGGIGGGGDGFAVNNGGGGGGGGGRFGGGGGENGATGGSEGGAGGGGGSGGFDTLVGGRVSIAGSGTTAGNSSDPYYASSAGAGGAGSTAANGAVNGNPGRVVISYYSPPSSTGSDLDENSDTVFANWSPPEQGQDIRLRMTVQVGTTALATSSQGFKLQFAELPVAGAACTQAVSWNDVGASTSSSVWRFASNPAVTDGIDVGPLLLTGSDARGSYEESNPTIANPMAVPLDGDIEYDFPLQNNTATRASMYCFRMVRSGGSALNTYTRYPAIITQPYEQMQEDLLRHGEFFSEQQLEQPYYWAEIY